MISLHYSFRAFRLRGFISILVMLHVLLIISRSHAQQTGIDIILFKAPSVTCDYLIICPQQFFSEAQRLAIHRNTFTADDVENAKIVTIATVESEFPIADSLPRGLAIRQAMHYAAKYWSVKPQYLVLIGDDSLVLVGSGSHLRTRSLGLIPTYVDDICTQRNPNASAVTTTYYSDSPYGEVSGDTLSISVGRIPAQSIDDCHTYIDKVIAYDSIRSGQAWQNKVVLAADDRMQGSVIDLIGNGHMQSADSISSLLGGFFKRKIYLSSFVKSVGGRHDQARTAFFSAVGSGARWCIIFAHGSPSGLTCEEFLNATHDSLFANDCAPTMFFSFSCSNGDFIRRTTPQMCKRFLFKPTGGCITYLGSTMSTDTYTDLKFSVALFSQKPGRARLSIGEAVTRANRATRNYFEILGDPALPFYKKAGSFVPGITRSDAGIIGITATLSDSTANDSTTYAYEVSHPKIVRCIDSAVFQKFGPFSYENDSALLSLSGILPQHVKVAGPTLENEGVIKFSFFVADKNAEARFDTVFGQPTQATAINGPTSAEFGCRVKVLRGMVHMSLNPKWSGITSQVSIFDMRGRLLKQTAVVLAAGQGAVDFNGLNVAEGDYFIRITVGQETAVRHVPFMR